jgi:signal transduction histidine kinase
MYSLRAKILFAYVALTMLIVGLSAVAVVELGRLAGKAREGSRVAELTDAAFELRRFEKNHFLYGQPRDLQDHARYAELAQDLLRRDGAIVDALAGSGSAARLGGQLSQYTAAMAAHAARPDDEALAASARALGHRIVTAGEQLSQRERTSLNTELDRHRRYLLQSLGVVAALLALAGALLARQVTRPLKSMEERMEAVASGRLVRLPPGSRERELASLTAAFNHVLDELERRQHVLLRAEKLAALGTLLSGVAHELNNPLSNISTSAQILKEDTQSPADFRSQLIADIDAETLRARRIVRALLDYAGDRAFHLAPVPLLDLVQETLRFLKHRRPAEVDVSLEITPGLMVQADRPRLQQVLLNLITNAYDALGLQPGTLQITARPLPATERDACAGLHPGEAAVEICLLDSGPGFPEAILPRLFDPFFTTKPVGQGSGLGLFIAHDIITEHGGCIEAANRPGGGARFRLLLSAAEGVPA